MIMFLLISILTDSMSYCSSVTCIERSSMKVKHRTKSTMTNHYPGPSVICLSDYPVHKFSGNSLALSEKSSVNQLIVVQGHIILSVGQRSRKFDAA